MSDAQKLIADTIGRHRLERNLRIHNAERVEWWECTECGWESEEFDLNDSDVAREIERVKRGHLAAEIDKAIGGLTREYACGQRAGDDPRLEPIEEIRWVSGWSEAQS
ncbi:hypothetical protein [Mycobacterium sp. CnD-18-1]|uniref:hypothetical protein n=1 Tax=Mycobacterium sp. CnD-18-1 TaxID=2917744 RepID=UPI001EF19292|nr:hypothetical protein [Mycobacterium sp. CnD-18-1]MCG7610366.1 hypothetical protein [Mycobacterium sp. CnD-18-1]